MAKQSHMREQTTGKRLLRWLTPLAVLALLIVDVVLLPLGAPRDAVGQPNSSQKTDDAKGKADGAEKGGGKSDGKSGGGPPPAKVRVATSGQDELVAKWEVIGRLREVRRTIVGTGQQGRVITANFEAGDTVRGGQTVLAQIDPTFVDIDAQTAAAQLAQAEQAKLEAEAELARSEAAVAEADAEFDQADKEFVRVKRLYDRGAAQEKEYNDARTIRDAKMARQRIARAVKDMRQIAVKTAEAAVLVAQAEVERVKEAKQRFNVMTPEYSRRDGSADTHNDWFVLRKIMEVGQWVQQGAPVAELISKGRIDAVVDVPERLINAVPINSSVEVFVDPLKRRLEGTVAAVVPESAEAARTFPVKIRVDDLDGLLKPGMSVTAFVPTGEKQYVLTVPRDAVLRSARDSIVWAVKDGKALRISVDVLFGEGEKYAVETARRNNGPPLAPGMQVVIEGGERLLFPGQDVEIVEGLLER